MWMSLEDFIYINYHFFPYIYCFLIFSFTSCQYLFFTRYRKSQYGEEKLPSVNINRKSSFEITATSSQYNTHCSWNRSLIQLITFFNCSFSQIFSPNSHQSLADKNIFSCTFVNIFILCFHLKCFYQSFAHL